jgi:hypothetical protein
MVLPNGGAIPAEAVVVHASYPVELVPAYLSSPTRAIVVLAATTPRLSVT